MVRARLVAPILALGLAACASEPSAPKPDASKPAAAKPEMAAMGMPTPGPEHKQLLQSVGTWEGTVTMFMPDMPTTPAPAKEVIEPIGEFWTQSKFTCEFMGMPYLGTGCVGYDPQKHQYVGTWIDNMNPMCIVMSGEMDAAKKTLVMHWQSPDPATGKIGPEHSETVYSKDSYTATFYRGEGAGTKVMEMSMKRTSGAPK
jgi:Protein of unknown function (DUF1579)